MHWAPNKHVNNTYKQLSIVYITSSNTILTLIFLVVCLLSSLVGTSMSANTIWGKLWSCIVSYVGECWPWHWWVCIAHWFPLQNLLDYWNSVSKQADMYIHTLAQYYCKHIVTTYEAVFPDPVLARARISLPSNAKGIAFSCVRVQWIRKW